MNNYQLIEKALIYLAENFKEQPSLEQVAKHVGLSETYFQKIFTDWAGISPKKFLSYTNINYARNVLEKGGSIEDATYSTGLSSTSRLHDLFVNLQAMTPAEYKNGGENLTINYSFSKTHFGNVLIASTQKGICEVIFADKNLALENLKDKWPKATLTMYTDTNHQLVIDFINNKVITGEKINLHLKGTNFQLKVWEALLKIPETKIATYGQISKSINSKAYRAVGSAIGDNPIAFIIPCHRVIRSTGEFGKYRWGQEKKYAMLGSELSSVE